MRAGFKARQARMFAVHKAMREANTYKRPELRGFEAGEAWREANPEEETR